MVEKIIVIYSSKYGTTKTYGKWISESLNCECIDVASAPDLSTYDTVVYGGGIYAGSISGIKKLKKYHFKQLVLFTVSLSNPETTDYSEIIEANMKNITADSVKTFSLRGGIDYSKLSSVHKLAMAMLKKFVLDKKSEKDLTDDDRHMLVAYGSKTDFVNKETIQPIISYIEMK